MDAITRSIARKLISELYYNKIFFDFRVMSFLSYKTFHKSGKFSPERPASTNVCAKNR